MPLDLWSPSHGDVHLIPVWAHVGVPTSGASGTLANVAGPGDLLVDTTNKTFYQNTNTAASPTWTQQQAIGSSVDVTGGTIDGAAIGGGTPAAGAFTTLSASGAVSGAGFSGYLAAPPAIGGTTPAAVTTSALHVDNGTKTASATGGAATLNKAAGVITSEALTTAAGAAYTLTLTNSAVAATDQVFASVALGTATAGLPAIASVKPGAGSVVIVVRNVDGTDAFNGTIKISFLVVKN